jgi:hypothetical protein
VQEADAPALTRAAMRALRPEGVQGGDGRGALRGAAAAALAAAAPWASSRFWALVAAAVLLVLFGGAALLLAAALIGRLERSPTF